MKSILTTLALVLGFGSISTAAQAEDRYICELTSYSDIGWISPKLLVAIGDDKKTGWVYDTFIKEFVGDPLGVTFERRKPHIFTFGWRIKEVEYSNSIGSDSPQYRAMLNLKTMRLNETVVLKGMDGLPLRGQGKCEPYKG